MDGWMGFNSPFKFIGYTEPGYQWREMSDNVLEMWIQKQYISDMPIWLSMSLMSHLPQMTFIYMYNWGHLNDNLTVTSY